MLLGRFSEDRDYHHDGKMDDDDDDDNCGDSEDNHDNGSGGIGWGFGIDWSECHI